MKSKVLLGGACLLMAAGMFLYLNHGEIFATFLLDLVVGTLSTDPIDQLPEHTYSWGTKSWGVMNFELSMAGCGLLLIGLGQAVLLPLLIPRSRGLIKVALIIAGVLLAVSGFLQINASLVTMGAFGMLAQSGQADPVGLGEMLPVGITKLSQILLLTGESLIVLLAFLVMIREGDRTGKPALGRRVATWLSALLLLGSALAFLSVAFGPLTRLLPLSTAMDPTELANLITNAMHALLLGGGLCLLSGLLAVVAASLPAPKPAVDQVTGGN